MNAAPHNQCSDANQSKDMHCMNISTLSHILDIVPIPVFIKDAGHRYVMANQAFCRFANLPPEEIIGYTDGKRIPEHEARERAAENSRVLENGQMSIRRSRITLEGQGVRTLRTIKSRLMDDQTGEPLLLGMIEDITEEIEAEKVIRTLEEHFSVIFDNASQAILLLDHEGVVLRANAGFTQMFGYGDEIVGANVTNMIVPPARRVESREFIRSVLAGQSVDLETVRHDREGREIPVWLQAYPMTFGDHGGLVVIYTDISERKAYEEQLAHQMLEDPLTRLPNRLLFAERVGRNLRRSQQPNGPRFAVLMVDLDNFKRINDSLGHQAGDALIAEMARRISETVGRMDTVARFSGDEFGILVEAVPAAKEVIKLVRKVQQAMARPLAMDQTTVRISASVGIVLKTDDYAQADDILRDADTALYRAKEQLAGAVKVFRPSMHAQALHALTMEADMRRGLKKGEFTPYFQPIHCAHDGLLAGFEALARWHHPERGLVSPEEFIPVAEQTGLINRLGKEMLKESCRLMAQWIEKHPWARGLFVSVNLSSLQLEAPGMGRRLDAVLDESGLPPTCLKLEITETSLMMNAERALRALKRLKRRGVGISIDDFGTGYSSLSYLQRYPVDTLKADRSFIQRMEDSQESRGLVRSILALARALGLHVIAEGVETTGQLDLLREFGCRFIQGFLFSKPLPPDEVLPLLASQAETGSARCPQE